MSGRWVGIGTEVPVKDEDGKRPAIDEESGQPRETEFVPFPQLDGLEIEVSEMASVADRRFLEDALRNLGSRRGMSTTGALDFENTFETCVRKFIRGIRYQGEEKRGDECAQLILDMFEWDQAMAVLFTLREECKLAKRKKKSWSSRFGFPTESTTKE